MISTNSSNGSVDWGPHALYKECANTKWRKNAFEHDPWCNSPGYTCHANTLTFFENLTFQSEEKTKAMGQGVEVDKIWKKERQENPLKMIRELNPNILSPQNHMLISKRRKTRHFQYLYQKKGTKREPFIKHKSPILLTKRAIFLNINSHFTKWLTYFPLNHPREKELKILPTSIITLRGIEKIDV